MAVDDMYPPPIQRHTAHGGVPPHAAPATDPHAEFHRQSANHFNRPAQPSPVPPIATPQSPADGIRPHPAQSSSAPDAAQTTRLPTTAQPLPADSTTVIPAYRPTQPDTEPSTGPIVGLGDQSANPIPPTPDLPTAQFPQPQPIPRAVQQPDAPLHPVGAGGAGGSLGNSSTQPATGFDGLTTTAARWFSDPKNRKTAIGIGGIVLGALLFLAGSNSTKVVGLGIAVLAWAVCLRVAHTEKASFRIRTRLDREEVAGIAAELVGELRSPLSSVTLEQASLDELTFLVKGTTWRPLEFHATLSTDPDGNTRVATHLDSWTRNKTSVWFIPVPFSKTIDGFRLYKSFGERWAARIEHYDPTATVEYLTRT